MAKRAKSRPSVSRGGADRRSTRLDPAKYSREHTTELTPAAARPGPPREATELLERGMVALHRHDYRRAAAAFRQLLQSFPLERALADRARVYLALCERELAARPYAPQSAEERLTAATAALNNDDDREAERLVRFVLAEDPEHDLALYLLATVEARRGVVDAALRYLSQAVAVSPEAGAQARHDPDFRLLQGTELFEELTGRHRPTPRARRRPSAAER